MQTININTNKLYKSPCEWYDDQHNMCIHGSHIETIVLITCKKITLLRTITKWYNECGRVTDEAK